jgi:hypothetical protein
LPSQFLTGYSAAAGIALINSVGNLGGFAGPYMIGAIATRTGSLYAGLAIAGVVLFISATLVLLLPRTARGLGYCWGGVIHISDARVAPAKNSRSPGKRLIARGWSANEK